MKNSNDTIGNRSRELPVCSVVRLSKRHFKLKIGTVLTLMNFPSQLTA
jgi:hypothetical protein